MAADILLYDTNSVPVGDDQRQHLELARELANRFNNRYGQTFVVPEAAIPGTAARVMDLQHPERKMSKSVDSPLGTIGLLDSDDDITRKVRKAVTDTDGEMRFDWEKKPGLANLLEILAAATGRTPVAAAAEYTRYGDLKNDVAAALTELLRPHPGAPPGPRGGPGLRRRGAGPRRGPRARGGGGHVHEGRGCHGVVAARHRLTTEGAELQIRRRARCTTSCRGGRTTR